jgi:hypothetical protein
MSSKEGKHHDGDESEEAPPHRDEHERSPVIHPERIHPEHLAASFENLEELFAPDEEPTEHDYGVQPPG